MPSHIFSYQEVEVHLLPARDGVKAVCKDLQVQSYLR